MTAESSPKYYDYNRTISRWTTDLAHTRGLNLGDKKQRSLFPSQYDGNDDDASDDDDDDDDGNEDDDDEDSGGYGVNSDGGEDEDRIDNDGRYLEYGYSEGRTTKRTTTISTTTTVRYKVKQYKGNVPAEKMFKNYITVVFFSRKNPYSVLNGQKIF